MANRHEHIYDLQVGRKTYSLQFSNRGHVAAEQLYESLGGQGDLFAQQMQMGSALRRVQAAILGEEGVGREAEAFRREIEDEGIKVKDSRGRNWKPEDYSRMLLRTASGQLLNTGHVETASQLNAPGVRVFDGDYDEECREADGQTWSLSYALRNPLHHPNCRRSFAVLPSSFDGELDRE